MKLYILRHGDAVGIGEPKYPNDADRPLTPKGIQRTKLLAHTLRGMEISFDHIFSSPLTRARQTAEIMARGLKLEKKLAFSNHLSPSGHVETLLAQLNAIRPAPECVLVVGHEPYLSRMISLLCTGEAGLPLTLKKGGLCRLQVESLRATKCANLEWLLAPRVIESKRPKRKQTLVTK